MPDRAFWNRAYDVALDDLAELVAPERVVICEGEPKNKNTGSNDSRDARCYFPEPQFIPGGNASEGAGDKRGIAYAIGLLMKGSEVVRLIDRDDQSDQQVADMMEGRIKALSKRNMESYLFDDEVLGCLATSVEKGDKVGELFANSPRRRASERPGPATPR